MSVLVPTQTIIGTIAIITCLHDCKCRACAVHAMATLTIYLALGKPSNAIGSTVAGQEETWNEVDKCTGSRNVG